MMKLTHIFNENAVLVFKHLPLGSDCNPIISEDIHPRSCAAARAAEAARLQGKFLKYHDALFTIGIGETDWDLLLLGKYTGLDTVRFVRDFNSQLVHSKIRADIDLAIKLQVIGTPSIFINGMKVHDMRPKAVHFLLEHLLREMRVSGKVPAPAIEPKMQKYLDSLRS